MPRVSLTFELDTELVSKLIIDHLRSDPTLNQKLDLTKRHTASTSFNVDMRGEMLQGATVTFTQDQ